jgi:integrase
VNSAQPEGCSFSLSRAGIAPSRSRCGHGPRSSALALRAGVARFSTHTLRHLCLTDLARSGWELHAIARFAGHRNVATTLQYIHLSGRELAAKLTTSMAHVHTWRRAALAELVGGQA